MSIWKSTLITGSALGTLLTLGAINTATAGQGYYGYDAQGMHSGNYYKTDRKPGYFRHPIYGQSFKHPKYGYKFKHPVHGYMPMGVAGYGHGYKYGNMKNCGEMKDAGYLLKTGMHESGEKKSMAPAGDIVDVAVGAGSFNTLVTALKAADLVDTLKGEGPFTVFAPTDDAFAKIPKADLDALLADKEKLTAVLTYHVVPGKVMAADVVKLTEAKTVQGGNIAIDASDGVKVDNATVVKTDIIASNGVIHVIDTVIMPK
jgi:uncharacterized surface protein with fasciclin (FAS1) repeats